MGRNIQVDIWFDCVLKTVDAGRSRKTLIPIINKHCADGTVFCSDSWKAYYKLPEHLEIQDVLYFPVNHTNNYVDPITGTHTQTLETLQRAFAKLWNETCRSSGIFRLVYVDSLLQATQTWYVYGNDEMYLS